MNQSLSAGRETMELDISNLVISYTKDAKPIAEWLGRELERIARSHGEEVTIKFNSDPDNAS
jgi:ribosome biogenesis SPOUT family RNA methylase Rps3